MKSIAGLFEPDLQFVPAAHQHANRAGDVFHRGKNQGAGYDASSARERFVLNPALVGADRDLPRAAFFEEIYVRTLGRKKFMAPNRRTGAADIGTFQIV